MLFFNNGYPDLARRRRELTTFANRNTIIKTEANMQPLSPTLGPWDLRDPKAGIQDTLPVEPNFIYLI